jgi:hypothetical protein
MSQLAMEHATQAVGATELLVAQATDIDLGSFQAIDLARRRLELSSIALLRLQGRSWESMADSLGVTRQSLHYRIAKQVISLQQLPLSASRRTEVESVWAANLARLERRVAGLKARGLMSAATELLVNTEL